MPCDCVTYECLDVYYDPCVSTIDLGITADSTGTYKMIAEIDGVPRRTDIEVVDGESIVVPAVFNENYTHLTRFYKPDGTVLNETCYQIKTMATIFTNPASLPPEEITIEDVVGLPEELESLQEQIDALQAQFDGAVLHTSYTVAAQGTVLTSAIPANSTAICVAWGNVSYYQPDVVTVGASDAPLNVQVSANTFLVGETWTIFYINNEEE